MSEPIFEVRGLRVTTPEGHRVLDGLDWSIERGAVALMGPGGTGKSTLLSVLADVLPPGWVIDGTVVRPLQPVIHVRQGAGRDAVREALASSSVALLDEPDQGLDPDERRALVDALRNAAAARPVVLVTHDVALARAVADRVALLVAGRIVAEGTTPGFFERPPSELAARYIAQGNCWPEAPAPELPSHFLWLEPGAVAGMGRPGLLGNVEDDLAAIAYAGIVHVVSLTETALDPALARSFGLRVRHFPIRDMQVPAVGPTQRLVATMSQWVERGEPVAVHCKAGLGRTGTILAAYLAWHGLDAEASIAAVRARNARLIQNAAQERFVRTFSQQS
ncbi:MAG: dual specificity protein phosphatase family protein [Sandaracinaceae bacterium]